LSGTSEWCIPAASSALAFEVSSSRCFLSSIIVTRIVAGRHGIRHSVIDVTRGICDRPTHGRKEQSCVVTYMELVLVD
jgi:hypothetical protein